LIIINDDNVVQLGNTPLHFHDSNILESFFFMFELFSLDSHFQRVYSVFYSNILL